MKSFLLLCFLAISIMESKAYVLLISSASSLQEPMKEIAQNYQQLTNEKIELNSAASGTLLQQIAHGAPVDIFISADEKNIELANEKNLIIPESKTRFVSNQLILISSVKNPIQINSLIDLKKAEIKKIAIGNPKFVPAGIYAKQALNLTTPNLYNLIENKFVFAQNVKQALNYVIQNEVDVGFVYQSDIFGLDKKVKKQLNLTLNSPIYYSLAIIKTTKNKENALKFVDYLLSNEAQTIFLRYGFNSIKTK